MSPWTIGTWLAIVVLAAGSIAVFVWFLRDALRLMRHRWSRAARQTPPDDPGSDRPAA